MCISAHTLIRGTTPTLSFSIPVNENEISKICIAFANNKKDVVFRKNEDDVFYSHAGEVSVTLKQEDTLSLESGRNAYIQIKIKLNDGNVIDNEIIAENREKCSFIWDNYFDEETHINEYEIAFFVAEGEDDLFRRFMEQHVQRGYDMDEIKECIEKAGLIFEKAIDSDTGDEVTDSTERVLVVARECGK